MAAPAVVDKVPNFTGDWLLERSENSEAFVRAIGYSPLIARTVSSAQARQVIEHDGDELRCRFETVPPMAPARFVVFHVGEDEVRGSDDIGRETLLVKPTWRGQALAAGLRYPKSSHMLRIERYMEDGRMVEHLRYPGKGVEVGVSSLAGRDCREVPV